MFIRFRQSYRRLKVYIVEGRRHDGHVRQEIVAFLGSIEAALVPNNPDRERASIAARIAFWEVAGPKIKGLANRLGPDQQRLRMAVHARIPWPMQPERDRLELLNAQHEAEHWHQGYERVAKMIEANERMIARSTEQNRELRELATREINTANSWMETVAELRKKAKGAK